MSVGLIDLDHFKRVNDGLGHAAGDAVLRRFAEVGRAELRRGDLLARWGGEEFLLVMAAADAGAAVEALARIRRRLQDVSMDDIHPGLRITFSAGVTECTEESDIEFAIERADVAMYAAKGAGRDRTQVAEPLAPVPNAVSPAVAPPDASDRAARTGASPTSPP